MAKSNKNIISRIQDWIESLAGQTFLNYAYSWGAAVVILGALFKLTHIPGANAMLFVGMGTEVLVFFISGFDRPPGLKRMKTASTVDASDEDWDEEDMEDEDAEGTPVQGGSVRMPAGVVGQPVILGGPVVYGNGGGTVVQGEAGAQPQTVVQQGAVAQPASSVQQPFDVKLLAEMVNATNAEFLEAAREACAPEMKEAADAYVEELKHLTETLVKVSEQAECMTRDSKEMDNLNRTLTGINTIYEMQLKSISTQVSTIDQINDQTRKMARQIEELNAIYNRMIQAMTVNMKHTSGGMEL